MNESEKQFSLTRAALSTCGLHKDLSNAVLAQYVIDLPINSDWVSYRHPDYPWSSSPRQEQRFNESGQPAYYLASGDYCGQVEVPKHYERVPCKIAPHTIHAFDLHRFSKDHGYGDTFVQQRASGGWAVCQEVSLFLGRQFGITGVLYQSAALHEQGQFGNCLAVIPNREQQLPDDFFRPPSA